jgi:prepilin-type N-terminal cleavage/methylation domain-containing protein
MLMVRDPTTAGRRAGITLVEVLVSITVLSILSAGVSLLYIQALQMYRRGTREATARDKAALALERIAPEIREAANVDYPGPEMLVVTVPQRSANGHYAIDPATRSPMLGGQVAIYRSDASGAMGANGRYVWKAKRSSPEAAWMPTSIVTDDVVDLSFTYAPSMNALELVKVTLTIGDNVGPGYFNRTETVEVALLNH